MPALGYHKSIQLACIKKATWCIGMNQVAIEALLFLSAKSAAYY